MELWLPWVYVTLTAVLFVGSARLFWRKKAEQNRKCIVMRVAGVLTSPAFFLATIFLLLGQGCERNSKLIGSPDGKHVARVMVTVGSAVDQDYSTVIVRKSWMPMWRDAYFGLGWFSTAGHIEPEVKWLDNTHLLISYTEADGYPHRCAAKVGEIVVMCQPHKMVSE